MSHEQYNNNIELLQEYHKKLAVKLQSKEYEREAEIVVESEISKIESKILKVIQGKRTLYLQGKYNPEAQAETLLFTNKKISFRSLFFVVGFSETYLKKLLQRTEKTNLILVYEPCLNIFQKALEEWDLKDIFSSERILLVVDGLNEDELEYQLRRIIHFDNLALIQNIIMPQYAQLFAEKVKNFILLEKKCIEDVQISWNTIVRYTDVNASNVLHNLAAFYENYSVAQLLDMLNPSIPCIIVSAGPSLTKNIAELKNAVNKACIIATDTALKPLLNAGIKPDFFVVVDGKKPAFLFEHPRLSEIPMVMSSVVAKEVSKLHRGKKFYSWDGTGYESELIHCARKNSDEPGKINLIAVPTGGSVANTAFSFATLLGAKTIILVGQDLALTDNKTHADGTFEEKMKEIDVSKGSFLEVEDIHGGKVLTRPDFKHYLDWFNTVIKNMEDVKVIDATEGGAKIEGTEILTLRETIERECRDEIHVEQLLDKISPVFSEQKVKKAVQKFFSDTLKRLQEVKQKAEQGKLCYDKMLSLCDKAELDKKAFLRLSRKVKKINTFMNSDNVALMVLDSLKGIEYMLRATIYITEEDEKEERIMIAKQGRVMMEAISQCADCIRPIAEESIGQVGKINNNLPYSTSKKKAGRS